MEHIGNTLYAILCFIVLIFIIKKITSCVLRIILGLFLFCVICWLLNVFGI
ncbi:hypothetical protein HMPREF9144_1325 [Prevotella pallens ATCC 700821]|uniref:Uncharacterized protein n=1 Tax=Prevotella pallens ATCC 700821 TaxID=997353 RepID=F9DI35_9BACT|nr:hypothetical protein HMPREF9144_1325 [Prevotella pallens ATCC 700821]